MATLTVRAMNQTGGLWDPMAGQGQGSFVSDLEAVALILNFKLRLLQGEIWYSQGLGVPLFQDILSVPNSNQGVSLILRQQILSLQPYVVDIQNLDITFDPASRAYRFSALVQTVFGTLQIDNQSLPGSNAIIS